MDHIKIIAAFCIIEDAMRGLGHKSHKLAGVTDAEVLWLAVVASMYFHNHHERTLFVLRGTGYISKPLSTSRFSRRLHALGGWLEYILEMVGEVFAKGNVYVIDSLPVPVCKRVRAARCRKFDRHGGNGGRGRAYFGRCAAKKWSFYGWRLHLICTPQGVPVRFALLPASFHDLTPVYEITFGLPKGAKVYADKGYISSLVKRTLRPTLKRDGVHLITWHKKSMKKRNSFEEWCGLKGYRHTIETANSQLESMGIQALHARTNAGFALKVISSLFALACINAF